MARSGRRTVARDPAERVPTSVRLRGELFNKLVDEARRHDRALGHEIEFRLERSVAPDPLLDADQRFEAIMLAGALSRGESDVIRYLMTRGAPDDEERWRRWQAMHNSLISYRAANPIREPKE